MAGTPATGIGFQLHRNVDPIWMNRVKQEPVIFNPLFFKRVWGGRTLESLFNKRLPPEVPIGESWELVDRPEACSIIRGGVFDGMTLPAIWKTRRTEVFGADYADATGPFPLLVKILDAREKLSVQVHPPAAVAPELGGEPKTEMWHMLACDPGADLYVGLKRGVTRTHFEKAIGQGDIAELVHRINVRPGDTLFIPSGRIHAIGSGNVILEVQQNSDTTYRVFDWNRNGLDGKPRELHVDQSLASIDFEDFEPGVQAPDGETLVQNPLFHVERWDLTAGSRPALDSPRFAFFACISGTVQCGSMDFSPGDMFLVPASAEGVELRNTSPASVLRISIPKQ